MTELAGRSAHELAHMIRTGETTPSDVMAAHLDRIADLEPEVGAFQYLDPDRAMERARTADTLPVGGPLHGVPFAIKDIIDTADAPTGWGFGPYEMRQPGKDAACVAALCRAGAIPLGKTVTTEFAYFKPGRTANPHNLAHTPGGSSSGSAAAVAAGMAPLALGSQTAGSLVRPAAYCGIPAFRPTTGGFSLEGVMGLSGALDTLGVLATDIGDLALARAALTGEAATPLADLGDHPPRIHLMRGPHWMEGSVEMRDTCTRAMAALSATGAETGEIAHPALYAELTQAQIDVMGYETARLRAHEFDTYREEISPQFAALIESGQQVTDDRYRAALATRDRASAVLEDLLRDTDALLVPSAPGAAPAGLEATGDPLFSRMWNLLQVPTVALPFGTDAAGLPLGVQLIARRGEDRHLLAVARWVEAAFRAAQ